MTNSTMTAPETDSTPRRSLDELAAATPTGRNRAIDLYRVVAMVLVAMGHWLVIAIGVDDDGRLFARNALEVAPQYSWLTWFFQVMPLFFAVGGFASAMSLTAHRRGSGTDGDWIVQRVRRLVAPTVALAAAWLLLLGFGTVAGAGGLVAAGAVGAAIPLWFLANYTIDTALAPAMLTNLRRHRAATIAALITTFGVVELVHVVAGVPWIEHLNWVVGWLLFQMIGFLWADHALPTGRRLALVAGALWASAVVLVGWGPWPATMIHVSGVALSPTHPPSLALVVFGGAQTATAVALAPAITRLLERRRRLWAAVVAGNSISMSVYLWHFTAMVGASALMYSVGALPEAPIGSGSWWLQKLPSILLAFVLLIPVVALVSTTERRGLLTRPSAWRGSQVSPFVLAILLSISLKVWSLGNVGAVVAGAIGVVVCAVCVRSKR